VEQRLRVFENMVLRRIFGPKKDKVRGEWRKLHSEELYSGAGKSLARQGRKQVNVSVRMA